MPPEQARDSLQMLRDEMRDFTAERDWQRFHDPKSLLLALMGEVGELAELFQWLPANEAADAAQVGPLKDRVQEEVSDVLLYLIRFADVLGIDLRQSALQKMEASRLKFPHDAVQGIAPSKV